jgi:FKBP-type peptidyl-prolyl cis-trans isomerase
MKFRTLVLLPLALTLIACEQKQEAEAPAATTTLTTDEQRYSYGVGVLLGERIKQFGDIDFDLMFEAMKAQYQEQPVLMNFEEAQTAITARLEQEYAAKTEAAKAEGEAFLAENAGKEGVQVTDSGLQYSVITPSDGATPTAEDSVTVHYRGTLIDGTEFDSSYARGEPATFPLANVIPGWTEGLQLMSVGSKYKLFIPQHLGYGERGAGGSIGPFETLIFEVELLEINS